MDAMMKCASKSNQEDILSPTAQESAGLASTSRNISWKVGTTTQELGVKLCGKVEQHSLMIQALWKDLKNNHGKTTTIDFQDVEQRQQ